ncbi:peptidoglycan-binding protein [Candidatus Pelagibacter sp.]|nr:peptidoglycan-binding protein [Candidatus Pelagibacter sp.]
MKNLSIIIFFILLLNGNAFAKVKSKDITFPGKYYTKEIKTCSAIPKDKSFSNKSTIDTVKGVVGFDWSSYHTKYSNSIWVEHKAITTPIKVMIAGTHIAIGDKNQTNINIAKDLLLEIAKANTLYNSISYKELKKKGRCWKDNNPKAPCWYHEYEFAGQWFGNYMISAVMLKSELNKEEFKIVNNYIKKMYIKFLKPIQFKKNDKGFYAMANGGLSTLVYASWKEDKKLAAKEINHTFKQIDKLFYDDGYINDNSFRGLRGQWYHSYGVDIALGYIYIAELWGAKVPKNIQDKIFNSVKIVNLAITDPEKFLERKNPNGLARNRITDPKKATPHTHQMAIAIDTLMEIVTGIKLENDPIYLRKRKIHTPDGIDDLIGFNPNCIIR